MVVVTAPTVNAPVFETVTLPPGQAPPALVRSKAQVTVVPESLQAEVPFQPFPEFEALFIASFKFAEYDDVEVVVVPVPTVLLITEVPPQEIPVMYLSSFWAF